MNQPIDRERKLHSWASFRKHGLLWVLNASVLHPRGFAIGSVEQNGVTLGWALSGDGTEPWVFPDGAGNAEFEAFNRLLKENE